VYIAQEKLALTVVRLHEPRHSGGHTNRRRRRARKGEMRVKRHRYCTGWKAHNVYKYVNHELPPLIKVPVIGCGARESADVCAGDDVDTVVDDVVDADAADVEVDAEASNAADVAASWVCDVAIQEIGLFMDGIPSI